MPGIYDPSILDRTEFVATEQAEAMVRRLARKAGLFVGWSAGAAVAAAERSTATACTVVIGPDSGMRYLSERERLEGTVP